MVNAVVSKDLIFDVGMHKGEDSEFYLKKGFRVVAVEAVESFCSTVAQRLADSVSSGRLTIVNKAIAREEGPVRFFVNEAVSVWGTLNPDWVKRNARLGAPSREITVDAVRLERLFGQFGVPYYLKVDIEGADLICLEALSNIRACPTYVSIESNKTSWDNLLREFKLFSDLGYKRFKVVNQRLVPQQTPPLPAREGKSVEHKFGAGATGLFGEEAPGDWLSRAEALALYKRIFRRYQLFGDEGLLKSRITRRLTNVLGIQNEWYDTHAGR